MRNTSSLNAVLGYIIIFSFVYIQGLSFLNPLYLVPILLVYLAFRNLVYINISRSMLAAVIFFASILTYSSSESANFKILFMFPFSIMIVVFTPRNINKENLIAAMDRAIPVCVALFVLEFTIRLLFAPDVIGGQVYYKFKLNSFMGEDSNTVGMRLFYLFCLTYGLYFITNLQRFKYWSVVMFILILLTFSRTSVAAALIFVALLSIRPSLLLVGAVAIFIPAIIYISNLEVSEFSQDFLYRWTMFVVSPAIFMDYPITEKLLGVGLGSNIALNDTLVTGHSVVYYALVEWGLIVSMSLLGIFLGYSWSRLIMAFIVSTLLHWSLLIYLMLIPFFIVLFFFSILIRRVDIRARLPQ